MKVNQIYPIDIYEFNTDIEVPLDLDWKERDSGVMNAGPDLHRRGDWEWQDLTLYFQECLNSIHEHRNFDCSGFKITSMWANWFRPGTFLRAHRHANSYYSGVLFLTEDAPLIFYDPVAQRSHGQLEIYTLPKLCDKGFIENGPHIEKIEAVPGKVVIFPSWMVHDTAIAQTDRYSISFNALPYGKINQLTTLDVL